MSAPFCWVRRLRLGAGAAVGAEGFFPEEAGEDCAGEGSREEFEGDGPRGLAGEGEPAGGKCGNEDDGGEDAEDSAEGSFEDGVGIPADVEEVEVGEDEALGTSHPDA
ncbi:MAG: hypothetical protein RIS92_149 [Verrucomicrobiota bacterium]